MRKPVVTRTIKSVIDLLTFRSIDADELLNCDEIAYNSIRRAAAEGWIASNPRYVCSKCGYAVYAPRDIYKRPFWKHYKGAPQNCPWWTGVPSSIDQISAGKFAGQQEGPLHFRLKHLLAEILNSDLLADDVQIEKFIIEAGERRKPDVQATYRGVRTAFEIQLATTQLPVILSKETFYRQNQMRLVWVTWNFEQCSFSDVPQAFKDIYFSHNQNIFSLDSETVCESRNRQTLRLTAHAFRIGEWKNRRVGLSELSWNECGLPYVFPVEAPWHSQFKEQWIESRRHDHFDPEKQMSLLQELSRQANLGLHANELFAEDVPALLDCLYSLVEGRPVVSRQKNLVELANTFLNSPRRLRYAKIFEYAAKKCGRAEILEIASVKSKISEARNVSPAGRRSPPSRIVRLLFPEWLQGIAGRP